MQIGVSARPLTVLLDTHVLAWLVGDPSRVSRNALRTITYADEMLVSSVTAFEFDDLARRVRLPGMASFAIVLERLDITVLAMPADVWTTAQQLPALHRDPVDRMLIAHAIHADLTLVTADKTMREYPVRSVW